MKSPLRHLAPSGSQMRPDRRPIRRHLPALAAAVALAVSACGSGDDVVSSDDGTPAAETDQSDAGQSDSNENGEAVDASPAAMQEFGPVVVEGAPLDPYDSTIDDLAVGTSAPVLRGESFDGSEIVIGEPTERPTMVVFLAHWCGHCNAEVPELIELEEAGRIPDGIDLAAVSTAADPEADNFPPSEWLDDRDWPWPTMADDQPGTAILSYGGTAFPFTVILDSDGTVLARRAGQASGDDTVAFIESALASAA